MFVMGARNHNYRKIVAQYLIALRNQGARDAMSNARFNILKVPNSGWALFDGIIAGHSGSKSNSRIAVTAASGAPLTRIARFTVHAASC